jgi:hypothetical protein
MVKDDREMVVWTTPYVIASLPTDFNFAQESIAGVAISALVFSGALRNSRV